MPMYAPVPVGIILHVCARLHLLHDGRAEWRRRTELQALVQDDTIGGVREVLRVEHWGDKRVSRCV